MNQAEKVAYRRLLAHSVILMRAHSGRANQKSIETSQVALQHVNALADLFHNLALCSCNDFSDFKPDQFWRQFRHYRNRIPELSDFEKLFNEYIETEKI